MLQIQKKILQMQKTLQMLKSVVKFALFLLQHEYIYSTTTCNIYRTKPCLFYSYDCMLTTPKTAATACFTFRFPIYIPCTKLA